MLSLGQDYATLNNHNCFAMSQVSWVLRGGSNGCLVQPADRLSAGFWELLSRGKFLSHWHKLSLYGYCFVKAGMLYACVCVHVHVCYLWTLWLYIVHGEPVWDAVLGLKS